jgi:ferredoxin-NADP reductase
LGWRQSFEALLKSHPGGGNAGLIPEAASHPTAPGFLRLRVTEIKPESQDVLSFTMQSVESAPLRPAIPGQYVVVRLPANAKGSPVFRSYSLSGAPSEQHYRISVKIEPNSVAGGYLHERVRVGDVLEVSLPRGSFIVEAGERPLILLSAGIGATPVLAMLYALESQRSTRPVLWLHAARDGAHHPFAAEVNRLVQALANGRSYVCYSQPDATDIVGREFDATGHLSQQVFEQVGVSPDADVYLCGPNRFMSDMREILTKLGISAERVHAEIFNGGESLTPGIAGTSRRAPHLPAKQSDVGVNVSFARSGIAVRWDASSYRSILELAEACDVPVRWSCRAGVCHNCESGLVSGSVAYAPEPLDTPAEGNLLICCSQPKGDVVIDL